MIRVRRLLRRLWVPIYVRCWPLARLWYRVWDLRLEGHPRHEVWYFAYGANLHDSVFQGRRRMRPLEWRVGRVRGHRLRFNLEGRPKGRAAPANIEPWPGDEVWGVLYRITQRDMVRLHASEGVPGWRYRPVWLMAEDTGATALEAFTLTADGVNHDGRPSLRYITLLRDGARQHGLPPDWCKRLERVEPAE